MVKTVILSLLVSGALFAGNENMIPSFSDFDTNRDGQITLEEYKTTQKNRAEKEYVSTKSVSVIDHKPSFEKMDTNKNTFVDTVEYSEYKAAFRAKNRKH